MITSIIVLWCIPLDDYRARNYTDLTQYANELSITHYPDEYMFDVNGDWVSITPED